MFTLDSALHLIQTHGLLLLAPFAILEGPIATVIGAYLARLGFMSVTSVYVLCVVCDLIGDAFYYSLGRFGPQILPDRWQERLGLTQARKDGLEERFATKGGRTLLFGKWTHSAGLPIMIASGMGRMNFAAYMWYNLIGTLPKTLVFVALGYFLGHAYASIDTYIYRVSLLLLAVVVAFGIYAYRKRGRTT